VGLCSRSIVGSSCGLSDPARLKRAHVLSAHRMSRCPRLRGTPTKGYIRREPHPEDGRANALYPTDRGIELANLATRDAESAEASYFAALTPTQRDSLLGAFQHLASPPSVAPDERTPHDPSSSEDQR
jgi:hypothetical protein